MLVGAQINDAGGCLERNGMALTKVMGEIEVRRLLLDGDLPTGCHHCWLAARVTRSLNAP